MLKIFSSLKSIWNKQCSATKVLTSLGFIALLHTSISIFFNSNFSTPSSLAVRSVLSSIFGYIFGEQIITNENFRNKKFQIAVCSIIGFVTLTMTILSDLIYIDQNSPAIIEIRNLLFSSVGFLISRCKSPECN
ncbi:hypothetical protein SAMN02745163_00966 [Clostridium cavendishii DSM 21758]|uniref:Uncharacterized protein n=1 Tax=Clostridium cavendishii DSM 21758 TaxID=1121302 RepID=A0A1M6EWJ1_9CLOT|nr:hypothetical protein [Clostridium cavendishii]SHI89808.1 hypothetical protein SAMN02745163_00966 [Clostridium cavendishii DSM 21758]